MVAVHAQHGAEAGRPATARFAGLFPHRLLRWRRPVWWQELAIIAICYWLYTMGRNAVPEQASIALRHGRSVQHLQDLLHLNFELSVNEFVARNEWIAQPMDYYYATLHFVVTIGVLVWLFVKRPHVYRGARTVLAATSLLGLVGFFVYPLAPPRLLGLQFHYVDTLVKFHTWGSLADPKIAEHSNQYAAMPSLHIAWALWCGLAVFACAKPLAVRIVGLLYPVGTLVVIIGTANHFIIDAIAGALIVAMGFGLQWLMSGHGAYQPPVDAPDFGMPDPPLPSLPHSSHGA
ncbi:MAG: phosphatase PAP2 family protein [Actinomycetota bacterium]|nr:phosphatase PAP2 family protein [Actinomycetota bacterium]